MQPARGLWEEHWFLPDEERLVYIGPNWLQVLLDGCSLQCRDLVKLVLWRVWTVHNNITHESGPLAEIHESGHMNMCKVWLEGSHACVTHLLEHDCISAS